MGGAVAYGFGAGFSLNGVGEAEAPARTPAPTVLAKGESVGRADDLMDAALPDSVYVSWDPIRKGYAFKLKELDKPQTQRTEIAFRSGEVAKRWDRFYAVMGHVARRALRERDA